MHAIDSVPPAFVLAVVTIPQVLYSSSDLRLVSATAVLAISDQSTAVYKAALVPLRASAGLPDVLTEVAELSATTAAM